MTKFTYRVRVYYEDTDAAGIAYHTSYLKFMERTRTEWLRFLGFTHSRLRERFHFNFVVRSLTVEYFKPACLDDNLSITLEIIQAKRASLIVYQDVLRSTERLCTATIKLACVNTSNLHPQPFPKEIFKFFHDTTRATV